ncbi:hypothetical protein AVEN_234236-1 [Araneus ventricosus]|uniref:Uncharacterized protein n=1 Tax=Araneus ventricosus TaxID=182803 RepID=A0A4Y2AAC7_ARAVE|nr:hypothetical protein AVEN_234236-1 [Araneus ventricosus]
MKHKRACGHGAVQEPKMGWEYVEKSTHRVISRIKQSGPPKAKDRKVVCRAKPRQVSSSRSHNQRQKRRFAKCKICGIAHLTSLRP